MIRCKVTLAGVVNKTAATREGKDGKPFVSFGVKLPLGDRNGNVMDFEVSVSADTDKIPEGVVSIGKRVEVLGTMYFRKTGDAVFLNLYADSVVADTTGIDKIEGEMEFKGRTGKKDIQVLTDKRGKKFQTFSAYSKENSGDEAVFTWVHFLNFNPDKAGWLKAQQSIQVSGSLDLKIYNGKIDIGCNVKQIEDWPFDEKKTQEETNS